MRVLAFVAAAFVVLIQTPVQADVTQADLQIAARALSFMERPLSGTVRLGVVYNPGDSRSIQSADAVVAMLGTGLKVGNLVLVPVRVAVEQAAVAQVDAYFLLDGLGDRARPISEATEKKKIPCFTLDLAQVQNGLCALGVQVEPKVQIYANRAAAARSDTTFVSMFRMMITEF